MTIKQQRIIKKINAYLIATNGSLEYKIDAGICSGLSNFWLTCMANEQMDKFNSSIDYILEYTPINSSPDEKMETIIGALLIMQKNIYYLEDPTQKNIPVSLIDSEFLELTPTIDLINTYTNDELQRLLSSLPENGLIRISDVEHTVAASKKNGKIIIHDPNQGMIDDRDFNEIFTSHNEHGLTLHICAYNNVELDISYNWPQELLEKPIIDKDMSLNLAIAAGNVDLINRLIDEGADVNAAPYYPCYMAISAFQHEFLQILIDNGAELNVHTTDNSTLLHAAILQTKMGYYNGKPVNLGFVTLSMLLAAGADPNFSTKQNISAVSFAIHKGQLLKLALLVAYGAHLESHNFFY